MIQLSPAEAASGAARSPAILADVLEAVIAAIYLDGGFDAAFAFVERWWGPRLADMEQPPRDPKTLLQEWAQGRGLPLPEYRLVGTSGPDHALQFTIAVRVAGHEEASATASLEARRRDRRRRGAAGAAEQYALKASRCRKDSTETRGGRASFTSIPSPISGTGDWDARRSNRALSRGPGKAGRFNRTHKLRLCRADRRAERRQIDTAQPARRPQAGDRHAESADDAHAGCSASRSTARRS